MRLRAARDRADAGRRSTIAAGPRELYNASATAREVPATLPEEPLGVLTALAVAAAVEIAHTSAHLGSAQPALCGHAADMAVAAIAAGMRAQAGDRRAHAAAVECAHLVRAAIGELC
jgi:hypothetical protein